MLKLDTAGPTNKFKAKWYKEEPPEGQPHRQGAAYDRMQLVRGNLPVQGADSEEPREQQQPSEERHSMDAQAEGQGRLAEALEQSSSILSTSAHRPNSWPFSARAARRAAVAEDTNPYAASGSDESDGKPESNAPLPFPSARKFWKGAKH
eukprot:1160982-Pelagomonas_calceolata.AAC.1